MYLTTTFNIVMSPIHPFTHTHTHTHTHTFKRGERGNMGCSKKWQISTTQVSPVIFDLKTGDTVSPVITGHGHYIHGGLVQQQQKKAPHLSP